MSNGDVTVTSNVIQNLILIPIGVGIILYVIKQIIQRSFSKFYLGWEKYEKEKEKNVETKEKALAEWRKDLTLKFDEVKTSVDDLKLKMPMVVTLDQCNDSHDDMYDKINDNTGRIKVLETKVEDLRKK